MLQFKRQRVDPWRRPPVTNYSVVKRLLERQGNGILFMGDVRVYGLTDGDNPDDYVHIGVDSGDMVYEPLQYFDARCQVSKLHRNHYWDDGPCHCEGLHELLVARLNYNEGLANIVYDYANNVQLYKQGFVDWNQSQLIVWQKHLLGPCGHWCRESIPVPVWLVCLKIIGVPHDVDIVATVLRDALWVLRREEVEPLDVYFRDAAAHGYQLMRDGDSSMEDIMRFTFEAVIYAHGVATAYEHSIAYMDRLRAVFD